MTKTIAATYIVVGITMLMQVGFLTYGLVQIRHMHRELDKLMRDKRPRW